MADQNPSSSNTPPDKRNPDQHHDGNFLKESWEKFKRFFHHEKAPKEKILKSLDIEGVADLISSGQVKNIIVMTGAGVSTSAGIPDFRSPNTGLYDNMGQYNLPHPQAMFEIHYFKYNPEPFFALAKQLLPVELKPTPCHYFIRLLHDKGLLLRSYTQNIDGLDHMAGIPEDKVIEAHGSFHKAHCMSCKREYSFEWLKTNIEKTTVPRCSVCKKVVKPDVVLFGEGLPRKFFTSAASDFPKCDLLLIFGTSLVVQPFCSLVDKVDANVPRLLINREKAGTRHAFFTLFSGSGLEFDRPDNHRDVFWRGSCDDGCRVLAKLLGWEDELESLIRTEWALLDDKDNVKAENQ